MRKKKYSNKKDLKEEIKTAANNVKIVIRKTNKIKQKLMQVIEY